MTTTNDNATPRPCDAGNNLAIIRDFLYNTSKPSRPIHDALNDLRTEIAALNAVSEEVKNLPESVFEWLDSIGCDGNAIALRETLAALAALRGGGK